jgi:hypothetical protein
MTKNLKKLQLKNCFKILFDQSYNLLILTLFLWITYAFLDLESESEPGSNYLIRIRSTDFDELGDRVIIHIS